MSCSIKISINADRAQRSAMEISRPPLLRTLHFYCREGEQNKDLLVSPDLFQIFPKVYGLRQHEKIYIVGL
jgi:hypothetical protein